MYTYEIIYQDKSMFLESEPNRILNSLIKKIEVSNKKNILKNIKIILIIIINMTFIILFTIIINIRFIH